MGQGARDCWPAGRTGLVAVGARPVLSTDGRRRRARRGLGRRSGRPGGARGLGAVSHFRVARRFCADRRLADGAQRRRGRSGGQGRGASVAGDTARRVRNPHARGARHRTGRRGQGPGCQGLVRGHRPIACGQRRPGCALSRAMAKRGQDRGGQCGSARHDDARGHAGHPSLSAAGSQRRCPRMAGRRLARGRDAFRRHYAQGRPGRLSLWCAGRCRRVRHRGRLCRRQGRLCAGPAAQQGLAYAGKPVGQLSHRQGEPDAG
ncbi:hypothetical protein D3C87_1342470 [compost metagenome]